jgi:transposase
MRVRTAVQQPGMRTVAAKTEDQQAILHRIRSLLIKFRMQVNQLRGLLYAAPASELAGLRSSGNLWWNSRKPFRAR